MLRCAGGSDGSLRVGWEALSLQYRMFADVMGLQYTVLLLKLQPSLIASLLTSGYGRTNQRHAMPVTIKPSHHNPARALPAIYATHSRHQLSRISLQTVIRY